MRASGEHRHSRPLIILLVVLFLAGPGWSAAADSEDPNSIDPNQLPADSPFVKDGKLDIDAVVKYFEDLYRSDSSISEARLIATRPRRERTLQMKIWTLGEEKALVLIQAPPREKGTATLSDDKRAILRTF